jgi:hypothetical protein
MSRQSRQPLYKTQVSMKWRHHKTDGGMWVVAGWGHMHMGMAAGSRGIARNSHAQDLPQFELTPK